MAIEKVVFETEDGKQFQTLEEANLHEFREELKEAIWEGYWEHELHIEECVDTLLRDFNITRKEKESD